MKHLRFYFDCSHPQALAGFEQLPQRLQGLSVECSYLPVQAAHTPAGDALLRHAWACSATGRTPSRWVCEQVLNQAQRASEPPAHGAAALVARREASSPEVEADLRAAQAELSVVKLALAEGFALKLEGAAHTHPDGADATASAEADTSADTSAKTSEATGAGPWFFGEAGLLALCAALVATDKP